MCKIEKSLTAEGALAVEETFRPMRYKNQRDIARRFSRDVVREWRRFENRLYVEIQDISSARGESLPSLRTLERSKILHRENVEAVVLLASYLDPEELEVIEALFLAAGSDMRAIFAKYLNEAYQDGLNQAYDWMKSGHPSERGSRISKQDPERFAGVPVLYPINEASEYYRAFYDEALQTITSKVSIFFKGEAFAAIADGITNELTWRQIASNIRKDVGTGALWHWKRLVRTEMAIAYDSSASERYAQAGVLYVKRSVARTACPICVSQKGVYKLGEQPRVTADSHPNCRCTYIPYYSLPSGAEIRTFSN